MVLTDILPAHHVTQEEEPPCQVITVQNDGQVTSYGEKLGDALWSTKLSDLPTANDGFDLPEDFEVRHAELTTLGAASQGILSSRQDVLAPIESSDAGWTYILTILGTSPSVRHADVFDLDLHIYAIRASLGRNAASSKPQQLLSWNIPQAVKRKNSFVMSHYLDCKTGSLTELVDGKVVSYDLKGLSPRIIDTFTSRETPVSVVKLSSSLLLSASTEKLAVYDSKYGSQLATQTLPAPAVAKKNKANTEHVKLLPSLEFIDYFKRAGLVIALRGTELIAIQPSESAKSSKRKRIGTLLVDSIGKGKLDSRLRSAAHGDEQTTGKKRKTRIGTSALFTSPELDALLDEGNSDEFEHRFASIVNFATRPSKKSEDLDRLSSDSHCQWEFPKASKIHRMPVQRPQALYVLSKMFELAQEKKINGVAIGGGDCSIQLKWFPENIFAWLVNTGQLHADTIERALNEYHGIEKHVPHGDVMRALGSFDPDLGLVNYVLEHHTDLDIAEVVAAFKLIVKSLDNDQLPQPEHKLLIDNEFATAAASTGALTGGVGLALGLPNFGIPQLDGNFMSRPARGEEKKEDKQDVDMESVDAEIVALQEQIHDLDEKLDEPEEEEDLLSELLRQVFTRLNSLPRDEVTKVLRSRFTQHELIFSIHLLRKELDKCGWTTRYGDRADIEDEPSSGAINVIASMLCCAVDAVGMSGWLTASSTNPIDNIDETLTSMRGEISNTLEGVHESTFISGVLAEFLRYCHRLEKDPSKASTQWRKATSTEKDAELWKKGQTVVVEDAPSSALPMGLSTDDAHGVKTSLGKEAAVVKGVNGVNKKKTAADLGREIRRGLPPYVFERIRF